MKKKIIQEVTSQVIDSDGVVVEKSKLTTGWVGVEPDYVKLYLQDLLRISDIPKSSNLILSCILKRMAWSTNEIVLIAPVKRQIAMELEISTETIAKAIELFTEKSILIRKDRSFYIVNPYFFGRGKWEEISQIRLTVEYSAKGKMILKTNFDTQMDIFGNEKIQKE